MNGFPAAAAVGWTFTAPVLLVEGRGYGHGVGMAQDGAYAMGMKGATAGDVLRHFYPGTTIGRWHGGVARVDVFEAPDRSVVVELPGGGEVRDSATGSRSPGFPVAVGTGGSVRLAFDGRNHRVVTPAPPPRAAPALTAPPPPPPATATTAVPTGLLGLPLGPPPPAPAPPVTPPLVPAPTPVAAAVPAEPVSSGPLWVVPRGDATVAVLGQSRRYRGSMEVVGTPGKVKLVNHVDLEQYLRGMGEVIDAAWPAAGLQAQAIAARTYALGVMARGGNLCSTQQCQVYLGQTAEYAAMDRAVAATRGQVVLHQGVLAETVYSASGGGMAATSEEGFGRGSTVHPYLQSVPYDTRDPQPWSVTFPLARVAARFGYRGQATAMRVSLTGPSGRAFELTIDGDAGPQVVDGRQFFDVMALRSTLYTLRTADESAVAPPVAAAQPAPDQPAAVAAADASPAVARTSGLGRAPWVALSLVLLVSCSLATRLAAQRQSRPAATEVPGPDVTASVPDSSSSRER